VSSILFRKASLSDVINDLPTVIVFHACKGIVSDGYFTGLCQRLSDANADSSSVILLSIAGKLNLFRRIFDSLLQKNVLSTLEQLKSRNEIAIVGIVLKLLIEGNYTGIGQNALRLWVRGAF
jgi:predicted alpha/beta-fold hydrolase